MKVHSGIEIARLAALIAVISLHANAFGMFGADQPTGFLIDELSRFAVPLFFLISGYLWRDIYLEAPAEPLVRLFPRLAIPFVIWVLFYLACDFSGVFHPRTFIGGAFRSYLFLPLTGGVGFHLWFLPALFIGTALSWFGIRFLGLARASFIAAVLYLVGTALAVYLRMINLDAISVIYRNGLFFAPVFLILGHLIRQRSLPTISFFIALAFVGAALQIAEGWFFLDRYPTGHDMSLGTVPLAVGVFGLFLHVGTERAGAIVPWGRDVFGAYLVHLFFIRIFVASFAARGLGMALLCIVSVTLVSLVFSRILKLTSVTRYAVA